MSDVRLNTRRAVYGKMAGDTTLNALLGTPAPGRAKALYYQDAPQGASLPYVIFFRSAGTPTYTLNDPVAIKSQVWTIKGVSVTGPGQYPDTADAIADRLEALLNDGALSISGATQLWLRLESDLDYPEPDGDKVYHHCGGLFRLSVDPT